MTGLILSKEQRLARQRRITILKDEHELGFQIIAIRLGMHYQNVRREYFIAKSKEVK